MFTIPLAFTGGFIIPAGERGGAERGVSHRLCDAGGCHRQQRHVLVDYINQLRLEGMGRREAIIEPASPACGPSSTSITTILGLLVMASARHAGTALMQPMALVCIPAAWCMPLL